MTTLQLVAEWDKTFPPSKKETNRKVTFVTRYGLALTADPCTPKEAQGKCLHIIPRASLCDLYDGCHTEPAGKGEPKNMISRDELVDSFFAVNLNIRG